MLNFCDFIQVDVFTTNHHLNTGQFLPKLFFILGGGGISGFSLSRQIFPP